MKKAAEADGFDVTGEARLRHRHAEWLARMDSELFEVHVDFDGEIRKVKSTETEGKWAGRAG